MSKIKLIVFLGIFIVATSVMCLSGEKSVYEKKVHFNSPEEIIEVLNTKTLVAHVKEENFYDERIKTDDFNECLSRRKRVTDFYMPFYELDLQIDENYDEKSIINDYIQKIKNNMHNYEIRNDLKAYSLKGTAHDSFNELKDVKINIVFLDEGEGYVIDYFTYLVNPDSYDEKYDW